MAENKTSRSWPAIAHALSYTVAFLPLSRDWRALATIGGTHFVIDRWRLAKHLNWAKNQLAPYVNRPGHTATGYSESKPDWMAVWLMIITDNAVHLLINNWALNHWRKNGQG
jgi:hypothetical protein